MKTIITHLLLIAAIGAGSFTKAQVSAYSFSQTMGSYGAPSTGTRLGTPNQDDEVNALALPFTFTFNGTPYNSINVCSNGYLSFGSLNGFEYSAISDFQTAEVIAPFAQDLVMGTAIKGDFTAGSNTITNVSSTVGISVGDTIFDINFDFGGNPVITNISGSDIEVNTAALNSATATDIFISNGSIRYSVSGVTPSQVLEIEYRNFTRFFVYDEVINFKVRLYETSNRIEFIYGFFSPGLSSTGSEVGLKGTTAGDFNSREVNNNSSWMNSAPAMLITDFCMYSAQVLPASGLIYQWSPSVCAIPSVLVTQPKPAICAGETTTLSVSGAETYSWSSGGTASVQVVNPQATTVYTLFAFNGACSSSLAITQSVTANPTLSIVQSKSHICRGNTVTLTVSGASSYTWSNGATASAIVVSPISTTTFSVTGDNAGCQASRAIVQNVSSCVGLNESSAANAALVYPNPFNEDLFVNAEAGSTLMLSDALGNMVYTAVVGESGQEKLNTGSFKPGMYILSIAGAQNVYTTKIVKR